MLLEEYPCGIPDLGKKWSQDQSRMLIVGINALDLSIYQLIDLLKPVQNCSLLSPLRDKHAHFGSPRADPATLQPHLSSCLAAP